MRLIITVINILIILVVTFHNLCLFIRFIVFIVVGYFVIMEVNIIFIIVAIVIRIIEA